MQQTDCKGQGAGRAAAAAAAMRQPHAACHPCDMLYRTEEVLCSYGIAVSPCREPWRPNSARHVSRLPQRRWTSRHRALIVHRSAHRVQLEAEAALGVPVQLVLGAVDLHGCRMFGRYSVIAIGRWNRRQSPLVSALCLPMPDGKTGRSRIASALSNCHPIYNTIDTLAGRHSQPGRNARRDQPDRPLAAHAAPLIRQAAVQQAPGGAMRQARRPLSVPRPAAAAATAALRCREIMSQ